MLTGVLVLGHALSSGWSPFQISKRPSELGAITVIFMSWDEKLRSRELSSTAKITPTINGGVRLNAPGSPDFLNPSSSFSLPQTILLLNGHAFLQLFSFL